MLFVAARKAARHPPVLRESAPQRQRLLVEHGLYRLARGLEIEPVLRNQILAVGGDRIDVLQHLEALEVVVAV